MHHLLHSTGLVAKFCRVIFISVTSPWGERGRGFINTFNTKGALSFRQPMGLWADPRQGRAACLAAQGAFPPRCRESKLHFSPGATTPWAVAYPFVNVIVLELHKASADGCDVALLIGERHSASTFGVLQLWVRINASIADTTVQTVHDHCQFNCKKMNMILYICLEGTPDQEQEELSKNQAV